MKSSFGKIFTVLMIFVLVTSSTLSSYAFGKALPIQTKLTKEQSIKIIESVDKGLQALDFAKTPISVETKERIRLDLLSNLAKLQHSQQSLKLAKSTENRIAEERRTLKALTALAIDIEYARRLSGTSTVKKKTLKQLQLTINNAASSAQAKDSNNRPASDTGEFDRWDALNLVLLVAAGALDFVTICSDNPDHPCNKQEEAEQDDGTQPDGEDDTQEEGSHIVNPVI